MFRCVMQMGVGLSESPGARTATQSAAEAALREAGCGSAAAALVLTTPRDAPALREVREEARAILGPVAVVAPVGGVLAGSREVEGRSAVAVLVWSGVCAEPFWLGDLAGHETAAARDLELALGSALGPRDLLLGFIDPAGLDLRALLRSFESRPLGAPWLVCGAGPAAGHSGIPLWAGRSGGEHALAGLVIRGETPAEICVAQCGPTISEPVRVTRAAGHWILELDDEPALDRFRKIARAPLAEDLDRASAHLLVALPCAQPAERAFETGAFAVRPIRGFETARRGFAIAESLRAGAELSFVLRDAAHARDTLQRALGPPRPATGGVYLSCAGRGRRLFGHPDLEASYVATSLQGSPLAGAFGAFQLTPVDGVPQLLNYAGVLARFGPKP